MMLNNQRFRLRAGLAILTLFAVSASAGAQTTARLPLRADLQRAGQMLANQHQHNYGMSEEVARQRLKLLGFEQPQALARTDDNAFAVTALKNGQMRKLKIDRINGSISPVQ